MLLTTANKKEATIRFLQIEQAGVAQDTIQNIKEEYTTITLFLPYFCKQSPQKHYKNTVQ